MSVASVVTIKPGKLKLPNGQRNVYCQIKNGNIYQYHVPITVGQYTNIDEQLKKDPKIRLKHWILARKAT